MGQSGIDNLTEVRSRGASKPENPNFGDRPREENLANAGATVLDQPVVVDGNVITSRFIYDIPQFVDAIVAQLN
jgi:putative intracellular protease/amidase